MLTTEGSPLNASMFRDIKAALPVEANHVIGDLIARADAAKVPVPRLPVAYTHLEAYENQRGLATSAATAPNRAASATASFISVRDSAQAL